MNKFSGWHTVVPFLTVMLCIGCVGTTDPDATVLDAVEDSLDEQVSEHNEAEEDDTNFSFQFENEVSLEDVLDPVISGDCAIAPAFVRPTNYDSTQGGGAIDDIQISQIAEVATAANYNCYALKFNTVNSFECSEQIVTTTTAEPNGLVVEFEGVYHNEALGCSDTATAAGGQVTLSAPPGEYSLNLLVGETTYEWQVVITDELFTLIMDDSEELTLPIQPENEYRLWCHAFHSQVGDEHCAELEAALEDAGAQFIPTTYNLTDRLNFTVNGTFTTEDIQPLLETAAGFLDNDHTIVISQSANELFSHYPFSCEPTAQLSAEEVFDYTGVLTTHGIGSTGSQVNYPASWNRLDRLHTLHDSHDWDIVSGTFFYTEQCSEIAVRVLATDYQTYLAAHQTTATPLQIGDLTWYEVDNGTSGSAGIGPHYFQRTVGNELVEVIFPSGDNAYSEATNFLRQIQ